MHGYGVYCETAGGEVMGAQGDAVHHFCGTEEGIRILIYW